MSHWGLDRSARWGLFGAGFLLPVAIATLIRISLAPPAPAEEAGSDTVSAIACDPTRLDVTCPEGLVCVDGVCHELDLEPRCQAGEECLAPLCAAGTEYHRGRCFGPLSVDLAASACRGDIRWERTVRSMQRRCAEDRGDPEAPLTACDAALWEGVNRSDESFEGGLLGLPGTFSVHFPEGEPKRADWPPSTIKSYYSEALAEQKGALARARVILVIGRASMRSGTLEYNREVAGRRADLVSGYLREILGPGVQILDWSLASQFPLPPTDFKRPGHPAPIGWDEATTRSLARRLDPADELGGLDIAKWTELSDTINRVVLVVPIECDGTEFFPTPSFRGRGDPLEMRP